MPAGPRFSSQAVPLILPALEFLMTDSFLRDLSDQFLIISKVAQAFLSGSRSSVCLGEV